MGLGATPDASAGDGGLPQLSEPCLLLSDLGWGSLPQGWGPAAGSLGSLTTVPGVRTEVGLWFAPLSKPL